MTWWKNGLLLATGGVAGMAIAAWLESEGKFDDSWDRVPRRDNGDIDGLQVLVDKVRQEAEWAMEECTTDAQREKVYAEVNTSSSLQLLSRLLIAPSQCLQSLE